MFHQFLLTLKPQFAIKQLSIKGKFTKPRNQNHINQSQMNQNQENQNDYVVLLHGIGRSCLQMKNLAKFLQKNGFETINLSYPSTKYDLEKLAEIVHQKIMQKINSQLNPQTNQQANQQENQQTSQQKNFQINLQKSLETREEKAQMAIKETTIKKITTRKIHFIGYSMGGLLLRVLLKQNQYKNLGRVVQIAPPNQGSEVADFVQNWWLYKKLYGPAALQLTTNQSGFKHIFGKVNYELGIIAGNGTIDPISSFLIIKKPNDGKVAVEKTKLDGMKEHIIIKAAHTFMPYHKKVKKQTLHFLKKGKFISTVNKTFES